MRIALISAALLCVTACSGGIAQNRASVEWAGPRLVQASTYGTAWHSQADVRKAVMIRVAKEVSIKGYTHFAQLDENTQTEQHVTQTNQGQSYTTGTINSYGSFSTLDATTSYSGPSYSTSNIHTVGAKFYALTTEEAQQAYRKYPTMPVYSVDQFVKKD